MTVIEVLWYNGGMTPKLTEEQRCALRAQQDDPVPVEDERTHKVYFLYSEEQHQRAKQALQEQQDIAAIQQGIKEMEAGEVIPLEQADAEIRRELGFSPRTR